MDKRIEQDVERELPGALISWYQFRENAKVLFISGGFAECEVLFDVLIRKGVDAEKTDLDAVYNLKDQFDYIIAVGAIEKGRQPVKLLDKLQSLLNADGKLLLGAMNRLAVKYFCGDKDYFSNHVLDSIEGYRWIAPDRMEKIGGRLYSQAELQKMLIQSGIRYYNFYSVMPDLLRPQMLLADGYIPNEELAVRVFPQYKSPSTLFLDEEEIYNDLLENHMFHQMANGYFIECSLKDNLDKIDQITVQGDRKSEEALATIIKKDSMVSKRALYLEGSHKVDLMMAHVEYLQKQGVPLVEAWRDKDAFVMPFIQEQIATVYFRKLLKRDKKQFLDKLSDFRSIIINSSEHVPYEEVDWQSFEPGWEHRKPDDPNIDKWKKLAFGSEQDKKDIGVILKRGYLDMVSLNCFASDAGFLFFDQEFYMENLPANVIFIRTIDFIYRNCYELNAIIPIDDLLKYFHLYEHRTVWRIKGEEFLSKLRNESELITYHRNHRSEYHTVVSNKHRMDYSPEEYNRLFVNIFRNAGGRKLYIFGAGKYAVKFLDQFSEYYQIAGIIDNDESLWGKTLKGIEIYSPQILEKEEDAYKVFVCIRFFEDVIKQLEQMGVKDVSVYDPKLEYERPIIMQKEESEAVLKPYHIGYVAGVFDLFHIGHLNLLRRAKEQCNHLIVGVVTDEQVIRNKMTKPFVPFEERCEIVKSCCYVDEVVEIPIESHSTQEAHRRYHFDVQFSGSDYKDDVTWIDAKNYLRQHGADLIFFPYTETTSSTELKEAIRKR